MPTKPSNIKALETGTGKTWEYWLEFLESIDAKQLPHDFIARKVNEHGVNEWWSQGVTLAFEQHIGRREPGQTCNGDFQVTVSKTVRGNMDEALLKWEETVENLSEFDGIKILRAGSTSKSEKWRYWRCGLEDKSTVSVNIQTKSTGNKSMVAINHEKLQTSNDVEHWRAFWKAFEIK